LLLCLGTIPFLCAQVKAPLTNDGVLKLVRAGFSEAVLLRAIEVNQHAFDITPEALAALKEAGVSERVISAMRSPAQELRGEPRLADFDTGVYARISDKYVEMEPEIPNWTPTLVQFRSPSRPIPVRLTIELFGRNSRFMLTPNTDFLIVCPRASCQYELLRGAEHKPEQPDFHPIRRGFLLSLSIDRRSVHSLQGVDRIAFVQEKISDRAFKIKTATLSAGEYGLLNMSATPPGKIYTFTIR
jgi:hypothetical protein